MFVIFLFLFLFLCSPPPSDCRLHYHHRHHPDHPRLHNQTTIIPEKETAQSLLSKLNKPPLHTIQSPDGDLIDCIPTHLQPAFDHPDLEGQKPADLPEWRPGANESVDHGAGMVEMFQTWHEEGESCPEGTVPIRRIKEEDIMRASSIRRFGRKVLRNVRRDSTGSGHEVIISNIYHLCEAAGEEE